MLKYLQFWKEKRYWYAVFFSYRDGDQFQTSWVEHCTTKRIETTWDLQRVRQLVEESEGLTHTHARQEKNAFKTNVRFISIEFLRWGRY